MSSIGWGFHGSLERPGDLAVGYRRWEGVSWRLERPGGLADYEPQTHDINYTSRHLHANEATLALWGEEVTHSIINGSWQNTLKANS